MHPAVICAASKTCRWPGGGGGREQSSPNPFKFVGRRAVCLLRPWLSCTQLRGGGCGVATMNKDEWLKQIFNGAPPSSVTPSGSGASSPGGASRSAPPAPKLDTSGARSDSLVLSWQWPSAPPGASFELCWRESSGNGAWQRERLTRDAPSLSRRCRSRCSRHHWRPGCGRQEAALPAAMARS